MISLVIIHKCLEAGLLGGMRALIGLPLEHPFDYLKTQQQAHLLQKSLVRIICETYQKMGLRGFYSGVVINGARAIAKQLYRWPLMLALPGLLALVVPSGLSQPELLKALTGLAIASVEVLLLCPLERLKVWLMTAYQQDKNLGNFFRNYQGQWIVELFRGLSFSYQRQAFSWVSFLVSNHQFKLLALAYYGVEELNYVQLMVVALAVGIVNTMATMPFDCVKTHRQMFTATPDASLRSIYRQRGWQGLYVGWQVRLVHYMVNSLFTVPLLDHLEKQW